MMTYSGRRGAARNAISLAMALLLVVGAASCSSGDAPVVTFGEPPIDAVPWVFDDGWWQEPQIWAVTPQEGWDTASTIAAFDFPAYEAMNVSVVSWFEGSPVAIDELHRRGYAVVGQQSMINMYQPDRTDPDLFWDESDGEFHWEVDVPPPELAAAALVDPFGNLMYAEIAGLGGIQYLPYSVPHPAWQEYMTKHMKNLIDAGVDGYLIDDLASTSVHYPDFTPYTLQEFNRFLEEQFDPSELEALLESVGVDDLASFDYAAVLRDHLPADATSLLPEDWNPELPLFNLYNRFLALQMNQAAAALIETGREYAAETAGKEIPFSANIGLSGPDAIMYIPLLDTIEAEFFYRFYGYFRNGRGMGELKLARFFDKPVVLRTAIPTLEDLVEWGAARTVDLYGTMIADAVSSGGEFYVEQRQGNVEQDVAALAPYYRFRTDHTDLFGLEPLEPQVAVLLLWENVVIDAFRLSAYFGFSSLLADSGVQFDTVFGAKEYLSRGEMPIYPAPDFPLDMETLRTYPVVVIPQLIDLIESHAAMLVEYVDGGGMLVAYVEDEFGLEFRRDDPAIATLLEMLRSGAENAAGGRVVRLNESLGLDYGNTPVPALIQEWLDVMAGLGLSPEVRYDAGPMVAAQVYAGEDQLVVHFVNYNWDIDTLSTTPVGEFDVEIVLPDGFDRAGLTASLHTPGADSVELDVEPSEDGIFVTIPELHIWSVVSVVAGNG